MNQNNMSQLSQDLEHSLAFTQEEIKYFLESERLKSFDKDWPNDGSWFCTPEKLAKAGFFFKPEGDCIDNACCAFCKKELDGWEPDDDPMTEHKKHSSKCPFLGQRIAMEDMPLEDFIRFIGKMNKFKVEKIHDDVKRRLEEESKDAADIIVSHVNKK